MGQAGVGGEGRLEMYKEEFMFVEWGLTVGGLGIGL
jgi:hypothetical protein